MTTPPDAQPQTLKSLLLKGFISAVALAGATAVPIVVEQVLKAPTPNSAVTTSPQTVAPAALVGDPQDQPQAESGHLEKGKKGGKEKPGN